MDLCWSSSSSVNYSLLLVITAIRSVFSFTMMAFSGWFSQVLAEVVVITESTVRFSGSHLQVINSHFMNGIKTAEIYGIRNRGNYINLQPAIQNKDISVNWKQLRVVDII